MPTVSDSVGSPYKRSGRENKRDTSGVPAPEVVVVSGYMSAYVHELTWLDESHSRRSTRPDSRYGYAIATPVPQECGWMAHRYGRLAIPAI